MADGLTQTPDAPLEGRASRAVANPATGDGARPRWEGPSTPGSAADDPLDGGPRELTWAEVRAVLGRSEGVGEPALAQEPGSFRVAAAEAASTRPSLWPAHPTPGWTPTLFGINNAKMALPGSTRADDDEFGTLASISNALVDVGCRFVRQPGAVDLFYLRDPTTGRDHPLPRAEDMAADIDAFIRPGVEALLTQLRADGRTSVVLTFLTLGGGLEPYDDGAPTGFRKGTMVPADFSLHGGETPETRASLYDELDPENPATFPTSSDPVLQGVHDSTLDLSERYKQVWIQYFARAIGTMLRELATDMGTDARTFGGALLGIELFNEVNSVNVTTSRDGDTIDGAVYWAEGVYRAMLGFWQAFDHDEAAMPRLWWPSLASEQDDSPYDTFVLPFHRLLAETLRDTCARYGGALDTDVLVNQDMHWYRFREDQTTALAVTLIDNVKGLRDNFDDLGIRQPTISVCETGATALIASLPAAFPSYVVDEATQEHFQAIEVVRRLCTIAASGASFAAWHSLMGGHSPALPFYGTGLLDDDTGVSAPTAHWRPSAFTFKALATFWGWLRPYGGEVVLPAAAPGTYHSVDASVEQNRITVLRFRVGAGGTFLYLYVMFYDSAAAVESYGATVEYTPAGRATIWTLLPVPDSTGEGPDGTTPDDLPTEDLCTYMAAREETWRRSDPAVRITLYPDWEPYLLLSNRELSFEPA